MTPIFAKYRPIFKIFRPIFKIFLAVNSKEFATQWHARHGMHITPVMLLHYLVKHNYLKTNSIFRFAEGPVINF